MVQGEPVWAMNYYGYILLPDLIDGERAGATIKAALSTLYREGRFLGGFEWRGEHGTYLDRNEETPPISGGARASRSMAGKPMRLTMPAGW